MKVRIDTNDVSRCEHCQITGVRLERHHMGYDSYVGRFHRPTQLKYDEFLDCCRLCYDCHMEIHWIYEPYKNLWWTYNYGKKPLELRAQLIEICQLWLKGKILTSVPSAFRAHWIKTHPSQSQSLALSDQKSSLTKGKPGIG